MNRILSYALNAQISLTGVTKGGGVVNDGFGSDTELATSTLEIISKLLSRWMKVGERWQRNWKLWRYREQALWKFRSSKYLDCILNVRARVGH